MSINTFIVLQKKFLLVNWSRQLFLLLTYVNVKNLISNIDLTYLNMSIYKGIIFIWTRSVYQLQENMSQFILNDSDSSHSEDQDQDRDSIDDFIDDSAQLSDDDDDDEDYDGDDLSDMSEEDEDDEEEEDDDDVRLPLKKRKKQKQNGPPKKKRIKISK